MQPAADMEEGRGFIDGYEDHIRCWTPQTLYELNLGVVVGDIKPETDCSPEDQW